MKRFKFRGNYHKLIDGFEINESSREVKYSNAKIDFTGKGIIDLPLKYEECQLVEVEKVEESEGQTIEGTSFSIDYDKRRNFDYFLKGQTSQTETPTPSSPVPINITTGEQVVSVSDGNTTNDYEINLGKNLFYINDCTITNGGTVSVSNGNTITITGTFSAGTNISFDSYVDFSSANSQLGNAMTLSVQNIVNSGTASITPNRFFIASANTFPYLQPDATTGYQTKTITEAFNRCRLYVPAGTYDTTINVQLEKGQPTSYTPYKPPIYLGKIGTYQDYIFRNTTENPLYNSNLEEGQWYIHKEIGRVVLNGSENWSYISVTQGNLFRNNTVVTNAKDDRDYAPFCNYYRGIPLNNQSNRQSGDMYIYAVNNVIDLIDNSQTSASNLKTWLSTHNVEVYYVLNTPTNTLIEDEELINQLNSIKLLEGLNNISVSSPYLPFLMNLHYNFNKEYLIEKDIIYTGYVNNYTLPKMKNKLEYRELDIDLLSPLALATLRTADAVGTYNLQDLIKEIIQPLIDDGFTLKELNVGNNQISVNYLIETIESALNKLSNKFNFWWYIDKNKNIYVNDINSIFNKGFKINYNDNNKIDGLIDFTPKMESIDYCNTLDFNNVRLITKSNYVKDYHYTPSDSYYSTNYYNPIFILDTINPGDEIEFDIPFIINSKRKANSQTMVQNDSSYFKLEKITIGSGGSVSYTTLVDLTYDNDDKVIIPNNVEIADSYNDNKEFVFVKDSFFSNLIVGMKYNGNSSFDVGKVYSETALMYTKIRINDNKEISTKKDIISNTGIIEKQINMNEQWALYEDLVDIANSLIRKDSVNVEIVELKTDIENDLKVGDIIDINKPGFLTYGKFIITDKKRTYYDNVDSWVFNARNTNILESYIDLFRATEEEETSDKVYTLISSDYSIEGIIEEYEVTIT